MASELYVETLKGLTSGANANTVTVGSGQTLYAPGHVIQVVQGTTTTQVVNSTTSYADTGLSATITPLSTTSKILIIVDQQHYIARNTNALNILKIQLYRDATLIYNHSRKAGIAAGTAGNGYIELYSPVNIQYLDSPSTTSSVTYKTRNGAYTDANSGEVASQSNNEISTITLMEIAG